MVVLSYAMVLVHPGSEQVITDFEKGLRGSWIIFSRSAYWAFVIKLPEYESIPYLYSAIPASANNLLLIADIKRFSAGVFLTPSTIFR